jgi:AAA family ATP:ADP antiporter
MRKALGKRPASLKPAGERDRLLLFGALSASLLVAQQVAAKALRDALVLSSLPVSALPQLMLTSALIGVPLVLAFARLMGRFGPERVVAGLLITRSVLHLGEWWLYAREPGAAAALFYVDVSVLGAITLSGFWALVTERFDPHEAKRAVGVIALGSAMGGLIGGLLAERVGGLAGLRGLMLALAGSAVMSSLLIGRFGFQRVKATAPVGASVVSTLRSSSYLRTLSVLVVLTGLAGGCIDYVFKTEAAASVGSGEELVGFFALVYTLTALGTVVLQLTLVRPMLDRVGIGGTLVVLPAAIVAVGAVCLGSPSLVTLTLLRAAESTLHQSFFRSAYEPLYTPVSPAARRSAKTIIDVAGDRLGEILASGFVLLLLALLPGLVEPLGIGMVVLAGSCSVWLALRAQRGYVEELAKSLRNGRIELDPDDVEDATTRLTLSQTGIELDRRRLLAEIEKLQELRTAAARSAPDAATIAPEAAAEKARQQEENAALLKSVADLTSGDVARAKAALAQKLDPRLLPFVIRLLESDELAQAARHALKRSGENAVGQLVDALLDTSLSTRLRRRIPAVLSAFPVPRVTRGLVDALSDPEFSLRRRSALALRELAERVSTLRPPTEIVLALARRELDGSLTAPLSVSNERRLEHVFTLLGLVLDREALDLSLLALTGGSDKLRGTALEYLENVLPDSVRAGLFRDLAARDSVDSTADTPPPSSNRGRDDREK